MTAHAVLWLLSLGIFDKDYARATTGSSDEHADIAPDLFTAETPLSPFTWDMYERATGVYAPVVPPGSAFPLVPDDPALWPIKYPMITHDVGRTNDRSAAAAGGYSPLVPNELVVKEINELPRGLFGRVLVEVDARYQHNAVIVPDLSNDASYAEVLYETFGKRVVGVQMGPRATTSLRHCISWIETLQICMRSEKRSLALPRTLIE